MPIYAIALFVVAFAVLLSATALVNSRALIERLVGRNMTSRFLADLLPVIASGCRVLGGCLVVIGLSWASVSSGLISKVWIEKFGPPLLIVFVGSFMLVKFRKR